LNLFRLSELPVRVIAATSFRRTNRAKRGDPRDPENRQNPAGFALPPADILRGFPEVSCMRWKAVALAGATWPAVVGCSIAHNAARNIVNEPHVVHTQRAIEHDLRKDARGVWREVRADYPRHAFTAEFRDGFLDGYVDYLDRGGNGSLPAVPPSKYTRHKKYFTEEGQCLVKDYFLGFQYGQEIAIATGKRRFFTVPVLLPEQPTGPPAFTIEPNPAARTLPPPMPVPVPPQAARPLTPMPTPVSARTSERPPVPPATAPLPLPSAIGTVVNPPPIVEVPVVASVPKLPAPPREVPELPDYIPTPPIHDELPVVPPVHTPPPVTPPTHPDPREE
jgi:hypothetical protein